MLDINVNWLSNAMNGVSTYTKCKYPALLAEAIYINTTHKHVFGIVNIIINGYESTAPVAQIVKRMPGLFDAIDPGSNLPFAELFFFSLFKSHITS